MNITNFVPQGFSGLSQFSNDSLAGLTDSTFNQTAAVLTAFDSTSSRTWDLRYYWICAVPFLFTVSLFLVAGGIFRWSIQSAAKYAEYWRIATFFIAPIIYTGFYWALPHFTIGGRLAYFLMNWVCLIAFLGVRIYRAYQMRRRRRIWTAFAVLAGLSFFLDWVIEIPYDIPVFIVLPWAFLLWRWIVRDRSS
jgi:hypothetical protein